MLRIIYMGTPQFAVPPLEALIAGARPGLVLPEGYEIATVITRVDKPAGRGREIVYSPVKQAALTYGIPVWQPGSLKRAENIEALAAYHADLYIVAAFGQILPQAVLDQPRFGTLNIHASLLPKYRGVSPISEAILQGDAETGVTIMLLDAGVDTGPILLKRSIAHTHMLRKEDGEIAWDRPAAVLARVVRAYTPWPSAYTYWRDKLLKIVSARAVTLEPAEELKPGTVLLHKEAGQQVLSVATGHGFLEVNSLQLEGKKAMSAAKFVRGYPQIVGETTVFRKYFAIGTMVLA